MERIGLEHAEQARADDYAGVVEPVGAHQRGRGVAVLGLDRPLLLQGRQAIEDRHGLGPLLGAAKQLERAVQQRDVGRSTLDHRADLDDRVARSAELIQRRGEGEAQVEQLLLAQHPTLVGGVEGVESGLEHADQPLLRLDPAGRRVGDLDQESSGVDVARIDVERAVDHLQGLAGLAHAMPSLAHAQVDLGLLTRAVIATLDGQALVGLERGLIALRLELELGERTRDVAVARVELLGLAQQLAGRVVGADRQRAAARERVDVRELLAIVGVADSDLRDPALGVGPGRLEFGPGHEQLDEHPGRGLVVWIEGDDLADERQAALGLVEGLDPGLGRGEQLADLHARVIAGLSRADLGFEGLERALALGQQLAEQGPGRARGRRAVVELERRADLGLGLVELASARTHARDGDQHRNPVFGVVAVGEPLAQELLGPLVVARVVESGDQQVTPATVLAVELDELLERRPLALGIGEGAARELVELGRHRDPLAGRQRRGLGSTLDEIGERLVGRVRDVVADQPRDRVVDERVVDRHRRDDPLAAIGGPLVAVDLAVEQGRGLGEQLGPATDVVDDLGQDRERVDQALTGRRGLAGVTRGSGPEQADEGLGGLAIAAVSLQKSPVLDDRPRLVVEPIAQDLGGLLSQRGGVEIVEAVVGPGREHRREHVPALELASPALARRQRARVARVLGPNMFGGLERAIELAEVAEDLRGFDQRLMALGSDLELGDGQQPGRELGRLVGLAVGSQRLALELEVLGLEIEGVLVGGRRGVDVADLLEEDLRGAGEDAQLVLELRDPLADRPHADSRRAPSDR